MQKFTSLDQRLNPTLIFIALFAVAMALRVIFVLQWSETPYGALPLLDAKVYDDWAQAIAGGALMRAKAFYASPLYPYLLGGLYALFGHSLLLAGLFNALLGSLVVVVLAALTAEWFGLEAALIAGILGAFYRPLIFYTAPVMKESLGLLLLALFLLYALRALKQNRLRDYIITGAMLGLCALVRGNAVLLAPVMPALGFYQWRGASVKGGVVFVAAMLLCIAPATIHNYKASKDFVPINYADGFNLYIGNWEGGNGTNEYPPEISSDPTQEELTTAWVAEENRGREVKPSEVSAYWRQRAMDFILHNPWRDLVLLKDKFLAFWSTAETFDSYDIAFIGKNFDTLMSWPLVPFWMISVLAAFGAVAGWRARRTGAMPVVVLALAYVASVMIFYVTDRYRLMVVVFLLPLAGAALPFGRVLFEAKTKKQKKQQAEQHKWLAGAVTLALVFLFLGLRTPTDEVDLSAFDWGTLATIYSDLGQDQETLAAMNKALAISPKDAGAQALVRGSLAEEHFGRLDKAELLLKMAMTFYPADGVVLYNYGRLQAEKGDLRGALASFQQAVKLAPVYVLNYYALARIYQKLGKNEEAIAATKRGLKIDPSNELLLPILMGISSN